MAVASWITSVDDLCGDCLPSEIDDPASQVVVDRWGPIASLILWALTGRQFNGVRRDMIWPNVASGCGCVQWLPYPDGSARPIDAGAYPWYPDGWAWRDQACAADHWSLLLPHRPVRRVVEVTIGGEVVDPSTYRVKDRRWLVRCGPEPWPCFQEACSDGFTVTYDWGVPPPAGGAQMAGTLACELARACIPGCSCRLPARTQSVVQEGITQALIVGDPIALLDGGLTNISEVDLWVRTLNPNRIDRAGKVLTPFQDVLSSHRMRDGGP